MTIPAANRLGLAVGLANLVWAAFRILREMNDPQMPRTDWPLLGLGLTGPLVLMLIPAKLARREKHAGDYWWLYGLGLAAAALAGAMAEDFFAFLLIGLYAVCAIWSLVLFCLCQGGGSIRPIPGQGPEVRVVGIVSGQPRNGARFALGMATLAVAVAIPLYLLTPRSTFARLEFGKPRIEIGYAADQMVDLTQTGDLRAERADRVRGICRDRERTASGCAVGSAMVGASEDPLPGGPVAGWDRLQDALGRSGPWAKHD